MLSKASTLIYHGLRISFLQKGGQTQNAHTPWMMAGVAGTAQASHQSRPLSGGMSSPRMAAAMKVQAQAMCSDEYRSHRLVRRLHHTRQIRFTGGTHKCRNACNALAISSVFCFKCAAWPLPQARLWVQRGQAELTG